jgi:hypothetical protein
MRLVAIALSSVSPMQTIGTRPACSAACIFLLTVSLVSPNSVRRSEWPTIDVARAGSRNHRRADLAGERAVTLPMQVLRGRRDRAAFARRCGAASDVKGGAIATSTPRTSVISARNSVTYETVSATV